MSPRKQQVDTKNATVARRGDYSDTLKKIVAGGFCPFCEEHVLKHHRHPILHRSKYWLVTKNAWPYEGSRFHFLFIARSHMEAIEDMSPSMWTELQKLYLKLVRKHTLGGATLLIRSGDTKITGGSVNHLHAHIVVGTSRNKNSKTIQALVGFKK